MDFNFTSVNPGNPTQVVFTLDLDDTEAVEHYCDHHGLDLVEIDMVSMSVYVENKVGPCETCDRTDAFITSRQEIIVYGGEVDDVFEFCMHCMDAQRSQTGCC